MGAQEFDDCIVASGDRNGRRDGLTAMAARWREWRRQKMQAETNGVEEIFIGQGVKRWCSARWKPSVERG